MAAGLSALEDSRSRCGALERLHLRYVRRMTLLMQCTSSGNIIIDYVMFKMLKKIIVLNKVIRKFYSNIYLMPDS